MVFPTIRRTADEGKNIRIQVVYGDSDAELGRLLRPCHCRGSARYVHEGCLRLWRGESRAEKNYFQCPTCKFHYQLQQPRLAAWANHIWVKMGFTLFFAFLSMLVVGLVADPFINISTYDIYSDENLLFRNLFRSNIVRTTLPNGYTIPNKTTEMEHPWL